VKSTAAKIVVPFSPPVIGSEEMAEVLDVLESGWLSTGPRVRDFEEMFAEYVGSRHAIAVNSCTAALHLSLLAAGVGAGDEVITTPLTFCATANVIVHTGATPVFADVDPTTRNLTPAAAAAAITPRTRAVLPVHYAGHPADAAGFRSLADREGLAVIEDAAHAVEAIAGERKVGAIADMTCFSFYATKNLTTGEGGMVTTNNDDWAAQIRIASLHGLSRDAWARYAGTAPMRYDVVMPGFKYNMTDLQAALGIHQLAALEERLVRREQIARQYNAGLADLPLVRPARVTAGDRHARHLYTVLVEEDRCGQTRDALQMALYERGIATSVHFDVVHLQPYYRERFGFTRGMCPVAERIADTTLSLPFSAGMSDESVDIVIAALDELLG
jgi:dTDP-4-amino-4,6-dideoxygalactose transaminase